MSDKEYPEKPRPRKGTEKFDWYPRMPMEWFEIHSREPEKKEEKA